MLRIWCVLSFTSQTSHPTDDINLKPQTQNTQNEERRPKTTTMTSLETLTGMKRAGETVTADDEATNTSSNTNKKPKQEDAEIAPEGVPSSATRNNDAVLEITPEKSSSGTTSTSTTTTLALEEMDDTSLELIPDLIVNDMWKYDVDDVEEALEHLAILCCKGDARGPDEVKKNQILVRNCGGFLAVLKTMKRFPKALGVHQAACRAIGNAAADSLSSKEAAGAIGSIEAIVKAIKAFPSSQYLSVYATGALVKLLCKDNAERFVKAKGIEAVFAAMTKFPRDNEIQKYGCQIVFHTASLLNNQDQFIDLEALIVVSNALTNHRKDPEAKQWGQKALTVLAQVVV